jgi:hypothetical protein
MCQLPRPLSPPGPLIEEGEATMVRKVVHIVWHEGGEGHSITAEVWQGDQKVGMTVMGDQEMNQRELAILAELVHQEAFPSLF